MIRYAPFLLACVALGACVMAGEPDAPVMPDDACGAARLQHLIGEPVPGGFAVAGPVRIYASGDPVTLDYNPRRLNIETNRAGARIVAISCG
ncbi:MAG: I78 family peptidase inhibitor [Pararhodobacter sp.]